MKRILTSFLLVAMSMAAWSQPLAELSRYNQLYFKTTSGLRIGVSSFREKTGKVLYCERRTGSVHVPSVAVHDGDTFTVTSIGHAAFGMECSFSELVLPPTIKEIEGYACYGMRGVVNIPDSVEQIGEYAFVLSTFSQGTVRIPATTSYIAPTAFCQSYFSSFYVDPANPWYVSVDGVLYSKDTTVLVAYPCGRAFQTFEVPEGVRRIASYAFNSNGYLTEVTLPQSLRELGTRALNLENCLQQHIPAGVCRIEGNPVGQAEIILDSSANGQPNAHYRKDGDMLLSMDGDTLLSYYNPDGAVSVPYGVRVLGEECMANCNNLTWLLLPDGLESIMDHALEYSLRCETFIPSTVRHIGRYAFFGVSFDTIRLPEGLTSLASNAFYQSRSLSGDLYLPSSLRIIPDSAFFATTVSTIHWPEGLEEIGIDAFANLQMLDSTQIHRLPSTLRRICFGALGMSPFHHLVFTGRLDTMGAQMGGSGVCDVRLANQNPPVIYTGAFNPNNPDLRITVPCGSLQSYVNATGCWEEYDDGVFVEDCDGVEPVDGEAVTVRGGAGQVVVAGAAGRRVEVYNVTGVRVTAGTATADPQAFRVPAAGIYLVRVADRTYKAAVR